MSRRSFLRTLVAAGAAAAGGTLLLEYAPWLDYDRRADELRRPLGTAAAGELKLRELVRYAALAANAHNSQPWKFRLLTDTVEIHPDAGRRLAVVDPDERELWISLGCALENLLIASRAVGFAPSVTYPKREDFIRVQLAEDKPQTGPSFDAIPRRQNTRSTYDGLPLPSNELDELHKLSLEPGVALHFVTNSMDLETVLEYVNEGNLDQYGDNAFLEELVRWIRFTRKEALTSMDGLYTPCTGNPEIPRWLGRMIVAGTKPQQQADADAKKLRTSSGAVVIASEDETKTAWVRTGQVYERLALKMTSLNIKSAFLNQPIEVPRVRGQFRSAMDLGSALPQLLLRYGHADPMPLSLRRPVEEVLLQA